MTSCISLNYFQIIQTNKIVTEKIFKLLNKKEFSLKSLVLENSEFRACDFEDFFAKHCSGLRSLKLKYFPNPELDRDHNPLIIASRGVFDIFQGLNPR